MDSTKLVDELSVQELFEECNKYEGVIEELNNRLSSQKLSSDEINRLKDIIDKFEKQIKFIEELISKKTGG